MLFSLQARLRSKEKLRGQEVALKKQIEKYDRLILETKADLEDNSPATGQEEDSKRAWEKVSQAFEMAKLCSLTTSFETVLHLRC